MQIAGRLSGTLAAALSSVIDLCDKQYVKLDHILTKDWCNDLFTAKLDLQSFESLNPDREVFFSQVISPLTEHMISRAKNKEKEKKRVLLNSKFIVT